MAMVNQKVRCGVGDAEQGFALPSVLFLVIILSLVAAGIVSLVFVQHRLALREVAKVKAEYAAQSGVAMMLAGPDIGRQDFRFGDGSMARVNATKWGMYRLVRSEGVSGKSHATRIALAANLPPSVFQHALVYGNGDHPLVFAGSSSIRGSVVVGQFGVTTGSLLNLPSPQRMPVSGIVIREVSPSIPQLVIERAQEEIAVCWSLLNSAVTATASTVSNRTLQLDLIPDSLERVMVSGNAVLAGTIVRRDRPLRLAVNGEVTLDASASVRGLVCLYASKGLIVSGRSVTEHAILISGKRIELEPGSQALGQIISPVVDIDSGASAKYPSIVLSIPMGPAGELQRISIRSGARVEGFVALSTGGGPPIQENTIEIDRGATVIGATLSDSRTTLDGTVVGSVLTKEFYFYEAPTQYLGWIRSGVIDRQNLPPSFLVPMVFSGATRSEVLDWL